MCGESARKFPSVNNLKKTAVPPAQLHSTFSPPEAVRVLAQENYQNVAVEKYTRWFGHACGHMVEEQ